MLLDSSTVAIIQAIGALWPLVLILVGCFIVYGFRKNISGFFNRLISVKIAGQEVTASEKRIVIQEITELNNPVQSKDLNESILSEKDSKKRDLLESSHPPDNLNKSSEENKTEIDIAWELLLQKKFDEAEKQLENHFTKNVSNDTEKNTTLLTFKYYRFLNGDTTVVRFIEELLEKNHSKEVQISGNKILGLIFKNS